ncbi:hypothetical protein OROGR_005620 [Orobanche gracilis]
MTSVSATSQLTHTISLPGQLAQPITVVAAAGVSDFDFRLCKKWARWNSDGQGKGRIHSRKGIGHNVFSTRFFIRS